MLSTGGRVGWRGVASNRRSWLHSKSMMSQEPETVFIPGLRLGELLFHEAVRPILKTYFPDLRYAAALIGTGSEILGFDTAISTDHDWGPRVMLFVGPHDKAQHAEKIHGVLAQYLPRQ